MSSHITSKMSTRHAKSKPGGNTENYRKANGSLENNIKRVEEDNDKQTDDDMIDSSKLKAEDVEKNEKSDVNISTFSLEIPAPSCSNSSNNSRRGLSARTKEVTALLVDGDQRILMKANKVMLVEAAKASFRLELILIHDCVWCIWLVTSVIHSCLQQN
eukprot:gene3691-14254_t